MPTPRPRARWFAPLLLLALSACEAPDVQARLEARQAAYDPPQLWRVQALGDGGAVTGEILVCTDSSMRAGFNRADAETMDGRPCRPRRDPVERPGLYANRCELDGHPFGMTVNRTGDPDRDFTVAVALRALYGAGAASRQIRHFQKVGACPAGWEIGHQAHPGQARGVNALKGTWAE